MMENYFSKNLKYLREKNNMSQENLAKMLGVKLATISHWENERREANMGIVLQIAKIFNVREEILFENLKMIDIEKDLKNISNSVRIPVLGKIPAGIPLEAIKDIIDFEEIPNKWLVGGKEYFALRISGDSMIPGYNDGDTVIFQKSEDCESGLCCAVMVNGHDATFKKVIKQDNGIILMPLNSIYEPQMFSNEDVELLQIKILGIAREIRRKV